MPPLLFKCTINATALQISKGHYKRITKCVKLIETPPERRNPLLFNDHFRWISSRVKLWWSGILYSKKTCFKEKWENNHRNCYCLIRWWGVENLSILSTCYSISNPHYIRLPESMVRQVFKLDLLLKTYTNSSILVPSTTFSFMTGSRSLRGMVHVLDCGSLSHNWAKIKPSGWTQKVQPD